MNGKILLRNFEETELPPIEAFYSKLNDSNITQEDYEHAINVWNTFKMKTMLEYHDLYLKTDVILLYDVIENFRNLSLDIYGLDPAFYYTSPNMAWDACLNLQKRN